MKKGGDPPFLTRVWKKTKMTGNTIHEIWRAKDQMAKRLNNDLDALATELRRRQKRSRRKVVNLSENTARRVGLRSSHG